MLPIVKRTWRLLIVSSISLASIFGISMSAHAQPALGVTLSLLSPTEQPVGSQLTWLAVPDEQAESLVYQFSIARQGGAFQIVRDFNVYGVLQWAPMQEGDYEIRVVMKDRASGQSATATMPYTVLPRVTGIQRAVTPTQNPLVALYSRPDCEHGVARVRYHALGTYQWQHTAWHTCQPGATVNILVAGMRADTTYLMQDEWVSAFGVIRSGLLPFTTGTPNANFPDVRVVNPPGGDTSVVEDRIFFSPWFGEDQFTFPFATDLWGRVVWYYPNLGAPWQISAYVLRPLYGGTILMVVNNVNPVQGLREIDLAGNVLRETNTTAVSDQLVALGHDPVISFHHDAVRLPNGHTLVLANVERVLEDVQGPGPINVLGDMILELDENWQVTWVWNSFEQLDVTRLATLNDRCVILLPDCPPLGPGPNAHDWTHSNTIEYIPSEGNLLLSIRNQDWVVKIDYQDGTGSGAVLWRLGDEGDFTVESDDPWPWFSHQHYARFWAEDKLVLLDNGNTRCIRQLPLPCYSRGQVYTLNEENLTATLDLNVDLGLFAGGWGDGHQLANGNYHFTFGTVNPAYARSLEITPAGEPVHEIDVDAALYRSFRMPNLYVPEVNPFSWAGISTLVSLPLDGAAEPAQAGGNPLFLPYIEAGG